MKAPCSHVASIKLTELPDRIAGRENCLAAGGWWVHLRMCQATARSAAATPRPAGTPPATPVPAGHPVARSAGPGEDRSYCCLDDVAFVGSGP